MKTHTPLTDTEGEVRELTAVDMTLFRPAHEVLPESLQATLGIRRRGSQKAPVKRVTTIRLSEDVLTAFQAAGRGWQTRIDAVLREAVAAGRV